MRRVRPVETGRFTLRKRLQSGLVVWFLDDLGDLFRVHHFPGFVDHKRDMSAAEYVKKVSAGELYDATLTFQIQNGFEARGVLENYIKDEATDSWAALIVWNNPDDRP